MEPFRSTTVSCTAVGSGCSSRSIVGLPSADPIFAGWGCQPIQLRFLNRSWSVCRSGWRRWPPPPGTVRYALTMSCTSCRSPRRRRIRKLPNCTPLSTGGSAADRRSAVAGVDSRRRRRGALQLGHARPRAPINPGTTDGLRRDSGPWHGALGCRDRAHDSTDVRPRRPAGDALGCRRTTARRGLRRRAHIRASPHRRSYGLAIASMPMVSPVGPFGSIDRSARTLRVT